MTCPKRPPNVAAWRRETPPDFIELLAHFSKPRTSGGAILKILTHIDLHSTFAGMKSASDCHYRRMHDNLASAHAHLCLGGCQFRPSDFLSSNSPLALHFA